METVKTHNSVMPAQAGLRRLLCQAPAFAGVTILLFSFSALAADAAAPAAEEKPAAESGESNAEDDPKSFPYAPDHCEFSAAFPEQPLIERRCEGGESEKCFEHVTFTKVFDMAATVNFRLICSAIDKAVHETYSAEIMAKTLQAMTDQNVVKSYDNSYREEDGYKQASLVGEGKVGQLSTIYIAQLWIGKKSALSVEAEMMGEQNDEADALFSGVLKSVHYKTKKKSAKEPAQNKKKGE